MKRLGEQAGELLVIAPPTLSTARNPTPQPGGTLVFVQDPSHGDERLNWSCLLWWLLVALLVELSDFLPLLRRQALHPLVVTALFYARRHARHKVLRFRQKLAVENPGDFVKAVPLH